MGKLKDVASIIWLFGSLICIAFGFCAIFDLKQFTAFFCLVFTIGTVFVAVELHLKELKEETDRILLEAKELYSLDYSKLHNIKQIELTNQHEYFVILKNDNNEWRFKLGKGNIPHTQLELEQLDKRYENMNAKIGDNE